MLTVILRQLVRMYGLTNIVQTLALLALDQSEQSRRNHSGIHIVEGWGRAADRLNSLAEYFRPWGEFAGPEPGQRRVRL